MHTQIPLDHFQSLAADLSKYLTLSLGGPARLFVDNSSPQEGLELWQKVVKQIRSRDEIRRHELLAKIQRPEAARTVAEIPTALEK